MVRHAGFSGVSGAAALGVLGEWATFSGFRQKIRGGNSDEIGAAVGDGAAVGWGGDEGYMAVNEARDLCAAKRFEV